MNINAIEELERVLGELDAKIKHLESSPNRAFVLVEYETLSLFHWFNECFKQFWDEFDHSANQLLLFHNIKKRHSEYINKYVALFREQIDYLESVIDFEYECVKKLPPVILAQENRTDVIDYYIKRLKDEMDEDGKPLFEIVLDSDTHSEDVDGKNVPIDFYMFRSNELNNKHYKGLFNMYDCLSSLYPLISTVCSYPESLQLGYQPGEEEIIFTLEHELRQHAKEDGLSIYRELKKIFLELKRSNSHLQPSDVWAQVLELETEAYRLAIAGKLVEKKERLFDHYDEDKRKLWTDNYKLLQKIKDTCIDDELFDVGLAVRTYNLLSVLCAGNLDLFYELVLRRNIIHSEMYPDKLQAAYEEWLKGAEKPAEGDVSTDELKSQNIFALKKNLKELLSGAWFAEACSNGKYDSQWTDSFVDGLIASEYGEEIARLWYDDGKHGKCNYIRGYIVGLLKDVGVLSGTYVELVKKLKKTTGHEIARDYLGKGKKQPYAEWVKEYVVGQN